MLVAAAASCVGGSCTTASWLVVNSTTVATTYQVSTVLIVYPPMQYSGNAHICKGKITGGYSVTTVLWSPTEGQGSLVRGRCPRVP